MGFYEDMERSLSEAIAIEKGNIPLTEKNDMPAPTFFAENKEKELIDNVVSLRKEQNISQNKLAEILGVSQQYVSYRVYMRCSYDCNVFTFEHIKSFCSSKGCHCIELFLFTLVSNNLAAYC